MDGYRSLIDMEIMSFILVSVLVIEIIWVSVLIVKKLKQPKDEKLASTEKMVKKILLNNQWDDIDDVIGILISDSVHITYKLR